MIGIAGPSGAGKTRLAQELASRLSAPIVSLDSYYRDLSHLPPGERALSNFDVPDALDRDLLAEQLQQLFQGQEIEKPVYDFSQHIRVKAVERLSASEFVIVEGLFTLCWKDIRALFQTRVFVSTEDKTCLERRIHRDVRERGRSLNSVIQQYESTVRPMAERYILPSAQFADIVVSGTDAVEQSAERILSEIQHRRLA